MKRIFSRKNIFIISVVSIAIIIAVFLLFAMMNLSDDSLSTIEKTVITSEVAIVTATLIALMLIGF